MQDSLMARCATASNVVQGQVVIGKVGSSTGHERHSNSAIPTPREFRQREPMPSVRNASTRPNVRSVRF
jgi:hypothetical protein